MAQPYNLAVMPKCGIALLNSAQAGECKIEFTRIAIGSGTYTEEEKSKSKLLDATGLKKEEKSYSINSKKKINNNSVALSCDITNYDEQTQQALITESFYINEIAIFARAYGTTQEILYSIAVTSGDTGDYMPGYNGYNPASIIQDYIVTINSASDIKIQVRPGEYALQADMNEVLLKIEALMQSVSNKVNGAGVTFTIVDGKPYITFDDEGTPEPYETDEAPVITEEESDKIVNAIFGDEDIDFYTDDSVLQGNEATQEDIDSMIEEIF